MNPTDDQERERALLYTNAQVKLIRKGGQKEIFIAISKFQCISKHLLKIII
jgi:hypothetical protein